MNNVPTVYGQYTKEQLLAMSGQLVAGTKDFLSNLYINKNPETKEGADAPVGGFTFDHKDLGQVYAPRKTSILFKPYVKGFRYEAYDPKANNGEGANCGRSIIFHDFKEEIISDNGLVKAGKLSPEKLPEGAQVRCKIIVYGTISFEGTDKFGKPVSIKDYPVFIKLGGKRFLDYDKIFKDFTKSSKIMFQYDLKLTPKHIKDSNYVAEIEWNNLTVQHDITEEVMDTLTKFLDYIASENKRVENKWKRIIEKAAQPTAPELVEDAAADNLSNDLKEEDLVEDAE